MLYAYGERAPSARDIPDRWLYELALYLQRTPDEIRNMNRRDRKWLQIVKMAQESGRHQAAQDF